MADESILQSELQNYVRQGLYPMHMPGHKRQAEGEVLANAAALPYAWDVTEVPGTDDLHDASGILAEAMNRTAMLYGAARTWYLVNGSTVGILAGIRAIAPYGSEVIVARNCHKAVYHAIELQNLTVHWIWPDRDPGFDIYESVDPGDVSRMLAQYPQSAAVILTSPTYEGVVSDIEEIARICHAHCSDAHPQGVPLFVDEAHGAHLGFHESFPDTAVHLGADLVVQSPHKTLPSLTQTAWLHLGEGARVPAEAVERELDVFETSSPSYPLMVSLDTCTGILWNHGEALFDAYAQRLSDMLRPVAAVLRHLRIYGYGQDAWDGQVYARDPSKVLISGRGCAMDGERCTGKVLARMMREDYQIETEMSLGWNVLVMTSICDTVEGMQRLADALLGMDRRVTAVEAPNPCSYHAEPDDAVMTVAEALRASSQAVPAGAAAGCVAAEYVYAYPPGIPVVVPGERISAEILQEIETWTLQGAAIHHSAGHDGYTVIAE